MCKHIFTFESKYRIPSLCADNGHGPKGANYCIQSTHSYDTRGNGKHNFAAINFILNKAYCFFALTSNWFLKRLTAGLMTPCIHKILHFCQNTTTIEQTSMYSKNNQTISCEWASLMFSTRKPPGRIGFGLILLNDVLPNNTNIVMLFLKICYSYHSCFNNLLVVNSNFPISKRQMVNRSITR